jgi:hypothetical protein
MSENHERLLIRARAAATGAGVSSVRSFIEQEKFDQISQRFLDSSVGSRTGPSHSRKP